ncbi:DUF927 domain-containing protein [Roseateles sp.]|uniref:DUF927 domain-containing protein n=1 Tax=Roseateles sp. TaxID=1971397 RepID=UPI00394F071C
MAKAPKLKAPRVITRELIGQALACVSPDVDRETWVRIGMAVKAELGADGFDLWNEWSAQAEGYSRTDANDTWRSIKAGGRVTVGTLFGIAKEHGFRFPDDASPALSPEALAEQERQHAEQLARRQAAQAAEAEKYRRRAEQAGRDAAELWDEASGTGESAYLQRKGVQAHGARFLPDGTLLVPMRDAAGELHNLQRIAPHPPTEEEKARGLTEKRFLSGGRKRGMFHVIEQADANGAAPDLVLIAEGYATAATLHEASGRPAVVGFDAGNLAAVAEAMPARFPGARFLVCGDDDSATETRSGKNAGRDGAEKAARKLRALGCAAAVLLPEGLANGGTDFNDLASSAGLDEVARQVAAAVGSPTLDAAKTPRKPRQATQTAPGAANDTAAGPRQGDDESNAPEPEAMQTPAHGGRDPFTLDDRGVWFTPLVNGEEGKPQWVCAPLHVTARTRDDAANGWGYLLEFSDPDGNAKQWAMPVAMLSGEGSEWAARLADMGLEIAHGTAARNRVGQYIKTRHPAERVTCTDRVGWHGGAYVLPSRCIGGTEGRRYVFQSEAGMEDTFRQRGELATWQREVSALCVGNSRFVFALSCAFAGALLLPAGVESGGFHFRSGSSQGKTSALRIAASVWGRPDYVKRWRTTDNALEATAVQHSDNLLILDEIAQLDAAKAGECAYMLANEQTKGRGKSGGGNRKQLTWRILFLSSGEVSLATHMADGGKRVMAGQEVRMVDIPLDAGQGMGGVEVLHGHASAGVLVEAITGAAARCYGVAGRAWLEWLCAHQAGLPERLREALAAVMADLLPGGAGEQVRRVARRFALVAVAGELACEAGITGWASNVATTAARRCFDDWLTARGHSGNGEEAAMLSQVKAWIEKNGDALLTSVHRAHDDHRPNTPLRAGFKRKVDENGKPVKFDEAQAYVDKRSDPESTDSFHAVTEYLILPEAWRREVCKGLDARAVAELMRTRGHLVSDKGGLQRTHRVPGQGLMKVYHLKASVMVDEL